MSSFIIHCTSPTVDCTLFDEPSDVSGESTNVRCEMASADCHRVILVKEVPSQESESSKDNEDAMSAREEFPPGASPETDKRRNVRFLDVAQIPALEHRGSIHEELCEIDKRKSCSSGRVRSKPNFLSDRPPPVFSITNITDTLPPLVFPSAQNRHATGFPHMETNSRTDLSLQEKESDEDVAVRPRVSRERRMTIFQHQVLDFQHSETAKTQLKLSLQKLSSFLCAAAIIAIVLAIADVEYSYSHGINANTSSRSIDALSDSSAVAAPAVSICLKTGTTLVSVVTGALLYWYFHEQCRFLIVKHHLPLGATVFTSHERWSFMAEFVLSMIHVPPLTNRFIPNELQLVCFLRLYLVGRYMREHNHMAFSKSTRFLASVLQTELGAGFLVKTFFIKWPFVMVGVCYCLNLFGVGYLVFSIDRMFSPSHHNNLQDVIWMHVVTMTTLGFGDVVPESVMARAFVGMSSVFGIFLMALLISVIHETLQMSQKEKRILAYVERQDFSERLKNQAARCIQATWRLYWFKRTGQLDTSDHRVRHCLRHAMKPAQTKQLLIKDLYRILKRWRETRKNKAEDDAWTKDFVADNTAILLTDVARRLENVERLLKRNLGIEEDEEEDSARRRDDQTTAVQPQHMTVTEAPPTEHPAAPRPRLLPLGQRADAKPGPDDGISMDTIRYHLADLGGRLEESHHRTMMEFQALQTLIMARKEEGGIHAPMTS